MKWNSNRVIAIILFLFSIFYLYTAFQIPSYIIPRPVDSDLFPKVLGISMLILSIFLFFEKKKVENTDTVNNEDTEQSTSNYPRFRSPRAQVVVSVIGIALYIYLFEKMGFILSSALFTFLMTYYYGYKRHVINAIVSLSVTLSFYFLLTKALGVYLPTGWIPL